MKLTRMIVAFLAMTTLLLTLACAEKSPEQRVMELRSHYTAELNGFIAKTETPPLPDPIAEEDLSETTASESSEGDGGEATEGDEGIDEQDLPVGPMLSSILLDVIVLHDASENLPGITLDVTQVGPDEKEKGHYRFWVDTSTLARGQQAQVNHLLEGVDYTDGDGFHVEVRRPIPEGQRSDYREFSP